MAVTADNSCSGKSEALLGANDVDDPLALVAHAEVGETEVLDILLEGGTLKARVVLLDEFLGILEVFSRGCGDVLWQAKRINYQQFIHESQHLNVRDRRSPEYSPVGGPSGWRS